MRVPWKKLRWMVVPAAVVMLLWGGYLLLEYVAHLPGLHWYSIHQIRKGMTVAEVRSLLGVPVDESVYGGRYLVWIGGKPSNEWYTPIEGLIPPGQLVIFLNPDHTVKEVEYYPEGEFSIDQWQIWLNKLGF